LHDLADIDSLDAYLLFVCFVEAPGVEVIHLADGKVAEPPVARPRPVELPAVA
jgi:hypothetical protein